MDKSTSLFAYGCFLFVLIPEPEGKHENYFLAVISFEAAQRFSEKQILHFFICLILFQVYQRPYLLTVFDKSIEEESKKRKTRLELFVCFNFFIILVFTLINSAAKQLLIFLLFRTSISISNNLIRQESESINYYY